MPDNAAEAELALEKPLTKRPLELKIISEASD
jgi:hypothetical protein